MKYWCTVFLLWLSKLALDTSACKTADDFKTWTQFYWAAGKKYCSVLNTIGLTLKHLSREPVTGNAHNIKALVGNRYFLFIYFSFCVSKSFVLSKISRVKTAEWNWIRLPVCTRVLESFRVIHVCPFTDNRPMGFCVHNATANCTTVHFLYTFTAHFWAYPRKGPCLV